MKALILLFVAFSAIFAAAKEKSNILIVFAHQEPQSFCYSLRNTVFKTLIMKGHEVKTSNLVQMQMILPLDKTDFTELYDPTYFRPAVEQRMANLKGRKTFSEQVRLEHDKVEWADIIVFVFPYYIMYMPGIMKGWLEHVLSYGFAYGEGHSLKGKKAMLMYTTGAPEAYIKETEAVFRDLVHAIFDFVEMTTLQPFTAYAVKDCSAEQRREYLKEAEIIAANIDGRETYDTLSQ